jgi:hypothetical protein
MNTDPTNENFDFHDYNDATGDSMNVVHSKTIMALSANVNRMRMVTELLKTKLAIAQSTCTFLGTRLSSAGIMMTSHDKSVVDTYKAVQLSNSVEEVETVVNRGIANTNQHVETLEAHLKNLLDQIEGELRKMDEEDGEAWKQQ